jgi:soluble lytic murein transglycosylase-like protein
MVTRFGLRPVLALLLPFVLLAAPALAGPAEICEAAIARGAARAGVPQAVLHAIALTETGRNDGGRLRPYPWAINREGVGHWFASREEALAFARASVAAGRPSFDVGCFQINYYWHGQNFASLEAMFDPDTGAAYAARFLQDLHAERGDWSLAAGAYHSQTPERAGVYRARFDRILAGIAGRPLAVAATAEPAAEAQAPAVPKRSRTRLSRGPKIITVPKPAPAATEAAGLGWRTTRAALVF